MATNFCKPESTFKKIRNNFTWLNIKCVALIQQKGDKDDYKEMLGLCNIGNN